MLTHGIGNLQSQNLDVYLEEKYIYHVVIALQTDGLTDRRTDKVNFRYIDIDMEKIKSKQKL